MTDTILRGILRHDVKMCLHTSWRVGGAAQRVYQPADLADLVVFLRQLPADEPLYPVGLGSNLLVRDGGLRGTVLLMHGALRGLRLEDDSAIYAEAGVAGAKLARFAALHHRAGAAFFAGIPGTVGGMLAMNAGCYGSETWQHVQRVQTINRQGEVFIRSTADYDIGYRHVQRCNPHVAHDNDEIFLAAWFAFESGDGELARQEIKTLLNKRIASQPLNLPNAGSVFRNPPNDHAARLIQACGLKGKQIGGAQVSEKHANFIVNVAHATAMDIETLIAEVQSVVEQQTGVVLQCEVKIVGDQLN
ncbi:MAG: UDP-N-acetylmuramate dehydrogenase [Gallionella sp.]|nr:UDP-N-acetylmuramate dehydrogenase [Gallionella sp.]